MLLVRKISLARSETQTRDPRQRRRGRLCVARGVLAHRPSGPLTIH